MVKSIYIIFLTIIPYYSDADAHRTQHTFSNRGIRLNTTIFIFCSTLISTCFFFFKSEPPHLNQLNKAMSLIGMQCDLKLKPWTASLEVCAMPDGYQVSMYFLLKVKNLAAPSDFTEAHQGVLKTTDSINKHIEENV